MQGCRIQLITVNICKVLFPYNVFSEQFTHKAEQLEGKHNVHHIHHLFVYFFIYYFTLGSSKINYDPFFGTMA